MSPFFKPVSASTFMSFPWQRIAATATGQAWKGTITVLALLQDHYKQKIKTHQGIPSQIQYGLVQQTGQHQFLRRILFCKDEIS